ncbi:TetR/AcrR family transcriptional regulator [Nocardia sp. NBC_01503]|uniref:TetR/AcrR family transcriptional regulator n=1 Tax=Nocardia sp. NBC_01503 TaxID=2975997 RepID=UPI002E7C2064|nr:TetR/AcrR family transcriptional regulator [Nocardia sp. NBC_01503]WTL36065.1 TetR/AcrR family transcriptional regulator [Nocardia sp. NBC_01503]
MGDPRAERTRGKLRQALFDECAERPLEQVSVSAVVRRARVSRGAFYLHYPDLETLAVDACAEVVRDGVEALHAWRGIPDPDTPPGALLDFFRVIEHSAALYRTLLRPGGSGPLGELLHRELRERSRQERLLIDAPAADLIASAVAGTFTGVLADWLHGLIDADADAVAARVWRLLIALHRTSPPPPGHR